MSRSLAWPGRTGVALVALFAVLPLSLPAQQQQGRGADPLSGWDVTQPRGKTREIDFTTSEGTWMAVDMSPDGRWIVFDLLGHIYRMPSTGGEAESLTQTSGMAINYQPRFSRDGRQIAFISDRRGQNNLWVMNADGSSPHAVFTDMNTTAAEPAWTPDSQYIIVRRAGGGATDVAPGAGGGSGLWMYHTKAWLVGSLHLPYRGAQTRAAGR